MPINATGEVFLRFLFELVLQVFGYLTGCIVVPAFSFGLFRVERIVRKPKYRSSLKNMRLDVSEPRVISADAGTFLGLMFWCIVGLIIYLVM